MSIEHAWEWNHFVAYSMPMANRDKIKYGLKELCRARAAARQGLKRKTFVNSRHARNPMEMYHAETEI